MARELKAEELEGRDVKVELNVTILFWTDSSLFLVY